MQKPTLYTPEEANKVLPEIRALMPKLREIRDEIIRTQDQCDAEEITSFGLEGKFADDARRKMDEYDTRIRQKEREFEKKIKVFEELGCELKGLDPGLVDFYADRSGELIHLCWREGETEIRFWHSLTAGFAGRMPL